MLPKIGPVEKTSIELRRAINRLKQYIEMADADKDTTVEVALLKELEEARAHIPKELRDVDLAQ